MLKICSIPVNAKVVLKSKSIPARGTKKTDDPKPLTVPITSVVNARIKKMMVVTGGDTLAAYPALSEIFNRASRRYLICYT